jgi:ABC-type uncharacterized transport system permease subunit
VRWREITETLAITLAAILTALLLFSAYLWIDRGVAPRDLCYWLCIGSFGTAFSWQNTLSRAAPLILTALCTALPARVGLIVIGGEGALMLGGLAAVAAGLALHGAPPMVGQLGMAAAGMAAGGALIAAVGLLRHLRGVNATISSLLATYVAISVFNFLVEGPMHDPATLNKPSTFAIPTEFAIGRMFGLGVHWGLAFGLVACGLSYVLMYRTTFGFSSGIVGGNVNAAQAAGLHVGRITVIVCALGGAAAGLAGMVEIAAVQYQANASLNAFYGFTGILVSFMARHHPLGIPPVAVLFGGLSAANGVLQRRLDLPNSSIFCLQGTLFVTILAFETLYRRFPIFLPREVRKAVAR